MTRIIKHVHGMPNPIIKAEEEAILAVVDKALSSSNNSQIVGANGEIPIRRNRRNRGEKSGTDLFVAH